MVLIPFLGRRGRCVRLFENPPARARCALVLHRARFNPPFDSIAVLTVVAVFLAATPVLGATLTRATIVRNYFEDAVSEGAVRAATLIGAIRDLNNDLHSQNRETSSALKIRNATVIGPLDLRAVVCVGERCADIASNLCGDLPYSEQQLDLKIPLTFDNVTFTDDVCGTKVRFDRPIRLSGTFQGNLRFSDSTFHSLYITRSSVKGDTDFSKARFYLLEPGRTDDLGMNFWDSIVGLVVSSTDFQGGFTAQSSEIYAVNFFWRAAFHQTADFSNAVLQSDLYFNESSFLAVADFSNLNPYAKHMHEYCAFSYQAAECRHTRWSVSRRDDEDIVMAVSRLILYRTIFKQKPTFFASRFFYFSAGSVDLPDYTTTLLTDAKVFVKRSKAESSGVADSMFTAGVDFRDTVCISCDFSGTQYLGASNFDNSVFFTSPIFKRASFASSASFNGAIFLRDSPDFENTVFNGAVDLAWEQIESTNVPNVGTFKTLKTVFEKTHDLNGINEALYRIEDAKRKTILSKLNDAFWGYGHRAGRLSLWGIGLWFLFSLLYWTQTKPIQASSLLSTHIKRAHFSLYFSFQTAIKPTWGITNARTRAFKVIAGIESIVFKILFALLLISLANVSPLARSIVGLFIH